jgi:carbohydrate ABC transporter membrane protein 1, CUT1 family (TC 3.A.1.1.-)
VRPGDGAFLAGLRGIDDDIWKAAAVDGIPAWRVYVFIVIPMLAPVFLTVVVLLSLRSFAPSTSWSR